MGYNKHFSLLMLSTFLWTIAFVFTSLSAYASSTNTDINGHWAQSQIENLSGQSVINGYPDGTFKPDKSITRAEFATALVKAFELNSKNGKVFDDTANHWAKDYISSANAAGIVNGYDETRFGPDNVISREQMAVMIVKAAGLEKPAAGKSFSDVNQISVWAKDAVSTASGHNVISGYPDNSFKPQGSTSRAEAAVVLNKFAGTRTEIKSQVNVFDKAGTYGPSNGTDTIKGNVTLKAKDVTLQNTVIEGDLTIDKAVADGNVSLKKVIVKGSTYINGGGSNSVYFIDTQIAQTYVLKDNGAVRIVASGTSEIGQLIAQSSVKIEELNLTGKGFETVLVDKKVDGTIDIDLAGAKLASLQIKSEGVTVKTDKDTRITTLIADAKVAVTGAGTVEKATVNASGVSFETKPLSQTVATGVSAPIINTSSSGGGGGGGSSTVTTASVGTAAELTTALANSNITTITFTANITASPSITRSLTMNFGAYKLTGNLTFSHNGTGTSTLTGNAGERISGNLTVNTPNASFNNGVTASGTVNIIDVASASWTESADGNTLTITDSNGATRLTSQQEQLREEWHKVKNTQRVLSIKNASVKLARLNNKSIQMCQDILLDYLQNIGEALFVTPWQVIDIDVLKQKEIFNTEELIKILEQEYFIKGLAEKEVIDIEVHLDKRYQDVQDLTIYAMEPQQTTTQEKDDTYPNHLSRAEKDIGEIIRFYKLWDSYSSSKRKLWKEHVLRNYLKKAESPQRLKDIALFPIFPDTQSILKVLQDSRCIHNIFEDYWIAESDNNDPAQVILWSQLIWQRCHKASEGIEHLLHNYINKYPEFDINELLPALKSIGINIGLDSLREKLELCGCFRISFNWWTTNKKYLYRFEPDFKKVIEYTLNCWRDLLKDRESQVIQQRIIQKRTLEETGEEFGVTRERIRQIETKALRKIRYRSGYRYLKPYFDWINNNIESQGIIDLHEFGLSEEDLDLFHTMYELLFEEKRYQHTQEGLVLSLQVYYALKLELHAAGLQPYRFFYANESAALKKLSSHNALIKPILSEYFKLVEIADGVYYYPVHQKLNKEEELFLIIHRVGRPLHFTEVEEFAELFKLPFSMQGEDRNILAVMQRTTRLRRTAPGTYGLSEWPIVDHIYLKDLICLVLEEAQRPLNINQIYQEVQARRNDEISKNSVYAYLNMHPRIIHNKNNQYLLKTWLDKDANLKLWGFTGDGNEDALDDYRERVILEVFERYGKFFTKYRVSAAYLNTSNIRISRTIKIPLANKIAVIDSKDEIFLAGFSFNMLGGLKRWGGNLQAGDIFYLEFINDKVIRFHTPEHFEDYKAIDAAVLQEAEKLWESQAVPVDEKNTQVED
ncbi:MAG: S-layer homology domain-containing protein, partial [Syntrophomonadaceae bacterium]|nr:S-layer homology domain-containing protein [Syntrophomonadaceae bacterium]